MRDLAKPGNPRNIGAFILNKNTTQGYRTPVFNLDLGAHMFCIDCRTRLCLRPDTVFRDIDIKYNMTIRRNMGRYLKLEASPAKLHSRDAIAYFRLVRQLRTLLNQGLHSIRCHHARAGQYFPISIRLQRA
ncbi:hypothetical protein BGZ97_012782 [Linnemannia gamsii]|uniref:Uncharacterized protein n=1 Tax=Linnemannia gamsii TaxID=64522 RepID=A0A9P6UV91_9FUNG|nr:hypothetical protein BGZ97_012782 [Linnemannia gamsii]